MLHAALPLVVLVVFVAWLLVTPGAAVRYALGGTLLLVAAIGFLFLTRGTALRHVVGVGADGAPVAPAEPEFPLSVAVLTGTVLSANNRVELALDGDGTFPRLWGDLRAARHTITVQTYYGKRGHVADTLTRLSGLPV